MAGKIKPAVTWSPNASADLAGITTYLESEWTNKTISAFLARLENLIERIQSFPAIGRKSASRRNVHLVLLEPHHQVVYKYFPRKKVIAILQVWDTRQDPRKRKG
ncbi:MAG: type II toxin-antitoxin system RelE/ParE family toxin [Chitinophagaceae bacterium]|nr:type II toxin-antitoxin system RelE/ParE family toxin [Chitinophagaceae bacterium]